MAEKEKEKGGANEGPATDKNNEPVVDPTKNVIALTDAANKRQDDLRLEVNVRVDAELRHLNVLSELRAEHAKEIRELESRRLDAIRQVDVTAVRTEADRALTAIQALATVTASNADNLRNALTSTATTIAKQTADTVGEITTRIAALEKSSFEAQGRSKVADPQFDILIQQMTRLNTQQATTGGERRGMSQGFGMIVTAIGLLLTLLSIGGIVMASRGSGAGSVSPQQPLYVPVPQGTMAPQPAVTPR